MTTPPLMLALAAPLDPFVAPFARAARQRTAGLVIGSALALFIAMLLASRLGHSLQRLAAAADDVAQGNLSRRIDSNGTAEVSRLALGSFWHSAAMMGRGAGGGRGTVPHPLANEREIMSSG